MRRAGAAGADGTAPAGDGLESVAHHTGNPAGISGAQQE